MKLAKSILLGSAAGLLAVSGASAADLPSRKAAPVEYVRVCNAFGAGFFFIPGTQTCLKVGGMARYELDWYSTQLQKTSDKYGSRATGRLELDARTATAYGTLRAFVRVDIQRRSGAFVSGTSNRIGQAINSAGGVGTPAGGFQTNVILDKAFIQFAGITAGRATSFFDFADTGSWIGSLGSSMGNTNLLAYTAVFGGGFSATLSLEDSAERWMGYITPAAVANNSTYGGQASPDIVAALRVDQAWGSAQLSAAAHHLPAAQVVGGVATSAASSKYGFAVQAGVKINLPMLAPGDALWLQAAYADGATNYLASGHFGGFTARQGFGALRVHAPDAWINPVTGGSATTKGWGVQANLVHFWTPEIRQGLFAGYVAIDNPAAVSGLAFDGSTISDFSVWQVGTNLSWIPVAGFEMGVELLYTRYDTKLFVPNRNNGVPATIKNEDQFAVRARMVRTF